jgi:putative membrane protein
MGIVAATFTQVGHHYDDHMDWNDGSGWWMALVMVVFGAVLLGVIVWAVATVTRSHPAAVAPSVPAAASTRESSARAILDERFARGEIDAAEYEERRRLLESEIG